MYYLTSGIRTHNHFYYRVHHHRSMATIHRGQRSSKGYWSVITCTQRHLFLQVSSNGRIGGGGVSGSVGVREGVLWGSRWVCGDLGGSGEPGVGGQGGSEGVWGGQGGSEGFLGSFGQFWEVWGGSGGSGVILGGREGSGVVLEGF